MMQSGKNYIAKGESEYESPRVLYLRELLRSVKSLDATVDVEEPKKAEIAPVKSVNKDKPTLKLTK